MLCYCIPIGAEEDSSQTSLVVSASCDFSAFSFQPLTCLELWQMVKQHYGNDLGLSHEEMESFQVATDPSMQTR